MAEAIEVLKKRRSIRSFKPKPMSRDALKELIDAARFAPSARNIQPWEFVIVTKKETLKEIAGLADNGRFIAEAAACVAVFCSDTKYYLEDGCAATVNIMLAATALGIGSCWVAGDKKGYCARVSELLNAPGPLKLVSLIALGFPDCGDAFRLAEKRPLAEMIHWEQF